MGRIEGGFGCAGVGKRTGGLERRRAGCGGLGPWSFRSFPYLAQASAPAGSGSVLAPSRTAERGHSANSQPRAAALRADTALFQAFAAAGKELDELYVNYEQQPEFPLRRRENPNSTLNWRLKKMRLSKDKTSLTCNDFLTLDGIPPEAFEYRLGNRSALEWVIDQYQVSTDKRSGITNEPEYIVRLLGQVVTVSLRCGQVGRRHLSGGPRGI